MIRWEKYCLCCGFGLALAALGLLFPAAVPAAPETQARAGQPAMTSKEPQAQAGAASTVPAGVDPYAREVTRRGNFILVSKKLADAAKRDNLIVLSKVAIKGRLDRRGEIQAYELVQIDKGSVVEKMGFRPGDLLTSVNAIPARRFYAERQSLEGANSLQVIIKRKGKTMKMTVEIK